ncbi:MAG: hypothetical protein J6X94_00820 [Lachnospiraceae bacterium]|nr:hypothetical protein [Lachnospiraceae bacterium]
MDGFLNLLQGKNSDAKLASEIQMAVDRAKEHKEWRTEYMTLALKLAEERAEGKAEGKTEGQNLLVEAVKLLREGKTEDDLKKAGIDERTVQLALLIRA